MSLINTINNSVDNTIVNKTSVVSVIENPRNSTPLYIPLSFWFRQDPSVGLAIPLAAIPHWMFLPKKNGPNPGWIRAGLYKLPNICDNGGDNTTIFNYNIRNYSGGEEYIKNTIDDYLKKYAIDECRNPFKHTDEFVIRLNESLCCYNFHLRSWYEITGDCGVVWDTDDDYDNLVCMEYM